MPTNWYTLLAVLFLFAVAIVLYYWLRRSPRSRKRNFTAPTSSYRVVGNEKWDSLTQRQKQVAGLAARGSSNSEIAIRLGVKPNTVDAHLKKIYSALDVHSRAELSYRIKDHID